MINLKDIYWVAGIIEGESCIHLVNKKYPRIRIEMTDKDVVDKLAAITKSKVYEIRRGLTDNLKQRQTGYAVVIYGKDAAGWLMTIYSLLGKRRQERTREVLLAWKNNKKIWKTDPRRRKNNRNKYKRDQLISFKGLPGYEN